jgi:hypothetical protein
MVIREVIEDREEYLHIVKLSFLQHQAYDETYNDMLLVESAHYCIDIVS